VVAGFTCTVAYPDFQHSNWTCTGDLASGASVNFQFLIGNDLTGPPAVVSGTSTWANTVTCTTPGACLDLTVSPANSDGSQLVFSDSDTITVLADVDRGTFTDAPAVEDLNSANATVNAAASYQIFNDSTTAVTGVTFSGSLTGTASRNTAVATVSNASWTCTTTQSTWSCTGNLAAETAASNGNNAPDAGSPNSQVVVTVSVPIVGAAAGQTVVFTPNTITCTGSPTPCTSGAVSPANADASNLLFPPDTDTLT
jgi:hypothetical protein